MFPEQVPTEPDPSVARRCSRSARSSDRGTVRRSCSSGDSDPIFSPRVAERLAELIPGAELQSRSPGAGHFLQEDAGEEVGQRIAAWLKSTSV
jgi:haloalkane dehalogenase